MLNNTADLNGTGKAKVGMVQSFQFNQFDAVENTLADLKKLGITHLRTNISWAIYQQPEGKDWYDWLFKTLGGSVELLPCFVNTPMDMSGSSKRSAPPHDPSAFAEFVAKIIEDHGKHFSHVELWNEPNNIAAYDFTKDNNWSRFSQMVSTAADRAHQLGKLTVLGGMHPVDPNWLQLMFDKGVMQHIDVVGVHGFPNVYDNEWQGWQSEITTIQEVLDANDSSVEVWITEAGFSTWQKNERKQLKYFIEAMKSGAARLYWNGLYDLSNSPSNTDTETDIRKRYFGLRHADGSPKLLFTMLETKGMNNLTRYAWMSEPVTGKSAKEKYTLITGGAGFVGTNLADRLLSSGEPVMVLDNLSRAGVQNNLFWLKEKHGDLLQIMIADICDSGMMARAVEGANMVYHFAAQVAVTSSLIDPFHDFEVNAHGTLILLEAIRNSAHQPPIVFTSTNKVYGDLHDLGIIMNGTRYHPENMHFRSHGIGEDRLLDFHSPYGCTKGVADQYILDYARTFGLKTVVFRMSCIYGPHQFGTEDQGWVAHFLIQALKEKPITLYGDGKQVRDILFVEDLVNAFLLARDQMDKISGTAFNMGGGVNNTVSLLELVELIGSISGRKPEVKFDGWRPSDQKYYVSNFSRYSLATGWAPEVDTTEGIKRLYNWLKENADNPPEIKNNSKKTQGSTSKLSLVK